VAIEIRQALVSGLVMLQQQIGLQMGNPYSQPSQPMAQPSQPNGQPGQASQPMSQQAGAAVSLRPHRTTPSPAGGYFANNGFGSGSGGCRGEGSGGGGGGGGGGRADRRVGNGDGGPIGTVGRCSLIPSRTPSRPRMVPA
jgi:hypothetical protein